MSEPVRTESGLLVPASATPGSSGPVAGRKDCFYWHERTGREVIDRYVTGRGYGSDELSQVSEIDQWRRPTITLCDWPECPWGVLKTFWPEGKPEPAGIIAHAVAPQKRCIVYCHPDQWQILCKLFEDCGYDVLNAEARFTPFRR